jgi:hypothetical protein
MADWALMRAGLSGSRRRYTAAWDNAVVAEKPIGQRVDRLEQVVQIIAEDQVSLQKLIAELARETRKGFDRVAKQFEETDKKMREADEKMRKADEKMREMMRETDQRFRQTDERIDKLVVAIGEFIRQQNAPRR